MITYIEKNNPLDYLQELLDQTRDVLYLDPLLGWLDFRQEKDSFVAHKCEDTKIVSLKNWLVPLKILFSTKTYLVIDCTKISDLTKEAKSCLEKFELFQDSTYQNTELVIIQSLEQNKALIEVNTKTNLVEVSSHKYFHQLPKLMSEEARTYGIPLPKASLLIGFPGTGKTEIAKLCAKLLDRKLYCLNIAYIYNNLVGDSEKALYETLSWLEDRQVVFFIDEFDKLFNQDKSSEVNSKIVSILLNWLSKDKQCYTVLAANRVDQIPIELLRKGRVDRVIHCKLPNYGELNRLWSAFARDLPIFKYPDGISHAEFIWLCGKIRENMFLGIDKPVDFIPMSVIRNDELQKMEEWAKKYES